ncbi:MAG: NAD-dependent epimerase/dehydratase family protein, partial [Myxococcota bacterium]
RPVFVTGATGLLGSCLTARLLESGAEVVALVRDWVPQSELNRAGTLGKIRVVRGDIRDIAVVERAIGEYEINTVFHLAAQTIVSIANRSPLQTFETNIQGTVNVLEACRLAPTVKQVVVASSDKAYGDHDVLPYEEDAPLVGRHPYDVSKSCADLLCQAYAKTYGTPVCVTRCGNFYGGGDLNWNRIVPGTIRSVVRGEKPVIRSDGKYIRDYFYIEDGAAAYMTLAEKLAGNRALSGEAFNFSNEIQINVLDLVRKILDLMGSPLVPEVKNEVSNEIKHQYLSAAKARKMLDWSPLFTIDQGLAKTISWYTEFLSDEK